VIPKGAAFDDGTGSKCCTDYFGYHYDAMIGTTDVPYSIVCGCDDSTYPNFSTLQVTTSTASHEMVEAASDPRASHRCAAEFSSRSGKDPDIRSPSSWRTLRINATTHLTRAG